MAATYDPHEPWRLPIDPHEWHSAYTVPHLTVATVFPSPISDGFFGPPANTLREDALRPYRQRTSPAYHCIVAVRDHRRSCAAAKIPREIWLHIFNLSLGSYRGEGDERFRPSIHSTPLKLVHLTRGLRAVALGAPELWSTICIAPNRHGSFPDLRIVRTWLKWAQTRPLTILFDPGHDLWTLGRNETPIPRLFNELARYMTQWDTVKFWTPWTKYFQAMNAPPQLRSLIVEGPDVDLYSVTPFISNFVRTAKSLKSFEWLDRIGRERRHVPGFLQQFPFASTRITRLDLMNTLDVTEFLQVMSRMPLLKECTIQNLLLSPTPTQPIPLIHLPELRTLKLNVDMDYFNSREENGPVLTTALSYLVAPALRSLSLGYDEEWDQYRFETFLQQSRCALHKLHFNVVCITEGELLRTFQLLTKTTRLEELTLNTGSEDESPLTVNIIRGMIPNPTYYLLPTLRSITVNGSTLKHSKGDFAQMVHARAYVRHGQMRSIHIAQPFKKRKLKDLEPLQRLPGLWVTLEKD
ncbi:hypothetical protein CC1G_10310 [Coprinopsis cinerea okayama7|uniref:F-box domain-containing protein n=1 Tax=Coprinopsis cinerea (strain Okayama-7 / 130 / ATCC MYA-4618 / FGSC 9003) TaxID=240176 RepID=A8P0H3_COPC7|nr:hypothetical protein CC1G_10310 [Coprinopsis cinerea okayama7\|eukprot:XP_001837889.1 hypothetical protein CC1G_10310 [Coprinopsis cinerea okayama7\